MAERKWEGTVNAKWNEKLNWSGAKEPEAVDDVVLPSGAPSLTIDTTGAACRSLVANAGYNKTLKMSSSVTLKIGTTSSNGGLCLKLNSEMTLTLGSASIFEFVAEHTTAEEITTAGRSMPKLIFNQPAGEAKSKWKLLDKLEQAATLVVIFTNGAELNTNGQELSVGGLEINVASNNRLKAGASVIKITGTSGTLLKFANGHGSAYIGSATFEFTGTGSTVKKVKTAGTESEFGTIIVKAEGVNFEESLKVTTLKLETKGNTVATKFLKSGKVIVTTAFSTNATSGSEVLIESTEKTKTFEFTYEGGTLEGLDWLKLEDCKAADSTHYYAGANSTLTNSANWKKEAVPGAANPVVMMV